MAYKINIINQICAEKLGGVGNHVFNIYALNEWCTLAGGIGAHKYEIEAYNELSTLYGGTGAHKYDIDALNEISVLLGGSGGYVYSVDALIDISSNVNLNRIAIKVTAGLFDFSWSNPAGRRWVFPDGTESTAERPTRTLATGGTVYLYSDDFSGNYQLNDNNTDARYVGKLADLQGKLTYYLSLSGCSNITGSLADLQGKLTYLLSLGGCSNITGSLADLQGKLTYLLDLGSCSNITGSLADLQGKLTSTLGLYKCQNITGSLADLQGKLTSTLSLYNCENITGSLSDLQGKLTSYFSLYNCSNITGIYTPTGSALPTATYLDNTGISTADMDQTLINYANQAVAINKSNGTFSASGKTRTAASDAAVATLVGKGWTVSGLTKI